MAEDDLLVQIETDKVTIDVRYQQREPGVLKEFLVKMDDTVQVRLPFREGVLLLYFIFPLCSSTDRDQKAKRAAAVDRCKPWQYSAQRDMCFVSLQACSVFLQLSTLFVCKKSFGCGRCRQWRMEAGALLAAGAPDEEKRTKAGMWQQRSRKAARTALLHTQTCWWLSCRSDSQ